MLGGLERLFSLRIITSSNWYIQEESEDNVTQRLQNMVSYQQRLASHAEKDFFVSYCDFKDELDDVSFDIDDLCQDPEAAREFEYWRHLIIIVGQPSVERDTYELMAQMAKWNMKMARQTLIKEYFKPLDAN